MSLFLSLDEARGVVLIRLEGIFDDEAASDYYQKMQEWMAVHGYFSYILDLTAVTSLNVTSRGVERIAANVPLVPDSYTRIILAPQDEAFGPARMFGSLGSQTRNKVNVIRTMADAYRLLAVKSLDLRPVAES